MTEAINLSQKFSTFTEHWQPRVAAKLNGQEVKLVKILGEFPWHHHDGIDELFFCVRGAFRMEFRDRSVPLCAGEMLVVPSGVEHRPVAEREAEILLFEPSGVRNTGNLEESPFLAPGGVAV